MENQPILVQPGSGFQPSAPSGGIPLSIFWIIKLIDHLIFGLITAMYLLVAVVAILPVISIPLHLIAFALSKLLLIIWLIIFAIGLIVSAMNGNWSFHANKYQGTGGLAYAVIIMFIIDLAIFFILMPIRIVAIPFSIPPITGCIFTCLFILLPFAIRTLGIGFYANLLSGLMPK